MEEDGCLELQRGQENLRKKGIEIKGELDQVRHTSARGIAQRCGGGAGEAGGGVKPGITYGQTDDFGYNIAHPDGTPLRPQPAKEKWTPGTMHIHDMNATILHLLGIDHRRLTTRYQGRDFRLTDVHGHVLHDLIA